MNYSFDLFHSFGFRSDIREHLLFNSNKSLIYASGRHLISQDIFSGDQVAFSTFNAESVPVRITCFSVCPSANLYALGEKTESENSSIRISLWKYDPSKSSLPSRIRVFEIGENTSKNQKIEFINFSSDGSQFVNIISGDNFNIRSNTSSSAATATKDLSSIGEDNNNNNNNNNSEITNTNGGINATTGTTGTGTTGTGTSTEIEKNEITLSNTTAQVWNWERNLLLCKYSLASKIQMIRYNPKDNNIFCVCGENYLRLWKVMSGCILKSLPPFVGLPREYKAHFIDICWLDNEIIVIISEEGDLLIIQENELKQKIDKSHGKEHIKSICSYDNNSFITVGTKGKITIYTPANAEEKLRFESLFQVYHQATINRPPEFNNDIYGISSSPNNKTFALLFNDSFAQFPIEEIATWKDQDNITLQHYPPHGCHSGAITDMSLSLVKPLLVTISNVDKSLRMWNYKTREQIFYMSFPSTSELNCVSVHPTGSYMLLTLYGKVRLYAILMNELRLMGELTPRGATKAYFSEGGQMFTIIAGKIIYFYKTFGINGMEQVATYKGHSLRVNSLCFNYNDLYMLSTSLDGAVYELCLGDFTKEDYKVKESVIKKNCYEEILYGPDHTTVIGSSLPLEPHLMKDDEQLSTEYQAAMKNSYLRVWSPNLDAPEHTYLLPTRSRFLCIFKCKDFDDYCLVMTMENGYLGYVNWPIVNKDTNKGNNNGEDDDDDDRNIKEVPKLNIKCFRFHHTPITAFTKSADSQFIFTGSQDGSLMIEMCEGYMNRPKDTKPGYTPKMNFMNNEASNEIISLGKNDILQHHVTAKVTMHELEPLTALTLIDSIDLNAKLLQLNELKTQMDDIEEEHQMKLKLIESNHYEQLNDLKATSNAAIGQLQNELDELRQTSANQLITLQREMDRRDEEYNNLTGELEGLYEEKIAKEKTRYDQLHETYIAETAENEERIARLQKDHDLEKQSLLNAFAERAKAHKGTKKEMEEFTSNLQSEYEGILADLENHQDRIVTELNAKIANEQIKSRDTLVKAKGELAIMRKTVQDTQKQLLGSEHKCEQLNEQLLQEINNKKRLERLLQSAKDEIESDKRLRDEKIEELSVAQHAISELERTRKVLQHQLQETKEELNNKQERIDLLEDQMSELDREFNRNIKVASDREKTITDYEIKIRNLSQSLTESINKRNELTNTLCYLISDIERLVTTVDPGKWKNGLIKLYDDYKSHLKEKNVAKPDTNELLDEYALQRKHIEKELQVTRNKAEINKVKFKNFTTSSLNQNVVLLSELNSLRKENVALRKQIDQMKIDYIPRKPKKHIPIGDPVIEDLLQKAFGDKNEMETDQRSISPVVSPTKQPRKSSLLGTSKSSTKFPKVPGQTKSMPVLKNR